MQKKENEKEAKEEEEKNTGYKKYINWNSSNSWILKNVIQVVINMNLDEWHESKKRPIEDTEAENERTLS